MKWQTYLRDLSLLCQSNIAQHDATHTRERHTDEIIDVDPLSETTAKYLGNRAHVCHRRGSSVCVEAGAPRRWQSRKRFSLLSNNTVLLHGDVPLLYFISASVLGPNCPGHCYKPEFSSVPIIKRQVPSRPITVVQLCLVSRTLLTHHIEDESGLISPFQLLLLKIHVDPSSIEEAHFFFGEKII